MPETTPDYPQGAFFQLPEEDQIALRDIIHHGVANKMNRELVNQLQLTQSGVNTAIGTRQKTKEVVSDVVELDSENYGAPPENSGIKANVKNASLTEPQAWEDEKGNWFYNFAGALQLAKALGRMLPDIHQLIAAINANPDNFRQNAGYRLGGKGKFCGRGEFSGFWSSSSEDGSNGAHDACLEQGVSSAGRGWSSRRHGLSVRFIVDRK